MTWRMFEENLSAFRKVLNPIRLYIIFVNGWQAVYSAVQSNYSGNHVFSRENTWIFYTSWKTIQVSHIAPHRICTRVATLIQEVVYFQFIINESCTWEKPIYKNRVRAENYKSWGFGGYVIFNPKLFVHPHLGQPPADSLVIFDLKPWRSEIEVPEQIFDSSDIVLHNFSYR